MMEKYIDFETAKLAKEKGFDWKTDQMYDGVGKISHESWNWAKHPDFQPRCHQALLQQWLRDRRQIHPHICYIDANPEGRFGWHVSLYSVKENEEGNLLSNTSFMKYHFTYEQALEQALIDSLKLL